MYSRLMPVPLCGRLGEARKRRRTVSPGRVWAADAMLALVRTPTTGYPAVIGWCGPGTPPVGRPGESGPPRGPVPREAPRCDPCAGRLSIESERYPIAVLSDDVSGTSRAVVTFTDDPALAGGGRRTPSVEDSGTGGVGARSTSTGRTALEASRNLSPPATAAGPSPDNTSVEHEPRTGRTSSPPRTAT